MPSYSLMVLLKCTGLCAIAVIVKSENSVTKSVLILWYSFEIISNKYCAKVVIIFEFSLNALQILFDGDCLEGLINVVKVAF